VRIQTRLQHIIIRRWKRATRNTTQHNTTTYSTVKYCTHWLRTRRSWNSSFTNCKTKSSCDEKRRRRNRGADATRVCAVFALNTESSRRELNIGIKERRNLSRERGEREKDGTPRPLAELFFFVKREREKIPPPFPFNHSPLSLSLSLWYCSAVRACSERLHIVHYSLAAVKKDRCVRVVACIVKMTNTKPTS